MSNLTLIIISILLLSISGQKLKQQNDNLCERIASVLCVKGVLLEILSTAKKVNNIAHEIEQHIFEHDQNQYSLNKYVNEKTEQLQSNLPTSDYHYQFLNVNSNINKTGLLNLLKEENDAFTYLYNSIQNILNVGNAFSHSINQSFKNISNELKKNVLCNYRSILHVYSETWSAIDEINGIQMVKTRKRHAPSFLYHSHSIIVARLLNEWMKHVDSLVDNVASKLS